MFWGLKDYSVSRYLSYVRNRENHSNPGTSQKSIRDKRKNAAACLYQADCDGEWGEIQFDFEEKTAQIIQLREKLTKEMAISFEE